jgi:hypothetical protein
MYDYRLVSAYMNHHLPSRKRPAPALPSSRVYQLPAQRRTPRNERSR